MNDPTVVADQLNILLLDTSRANQHRLSGLLIEHDYLPHPALSTAAALQILDRTPIDLILLANRQPDLDAVAICRQFKAQTFICDIPIIMIGGFVEADERVSVLQAGAIDFVTEPFQFAELASRISTHLTLRRLQLDMQEKNNELDAFAGMIAHDLRNPLTSLIMRAQTMQKYYAPQLDDRGAYLSEQMVLDGRRMADIIDSLLKLARLRHQQPSLTTLDMHLIVTEAVDRLTLYIEQGNATIQVPETWPRAIGYVPWVVEVWVNYIGNAIKYGGDEPQISLGADVTENHEVRFWVSDSGFGIAQEDVDKLFAPFSRLGHSSVEGYGLGLSIVKRIVSKLGGTVGVESQVNVGSTFWFTLPTSVKIRM